MIQFVGTKYKKMLKRTLKLLLVSIMGIMLVTIPVHATASYHLSVAGVEVTTLNKDNITGTYITGSISFDPETNTLTLNNATIDSGTTILEEAVNAQFDLTVNLIGTNQFGKLIDENSADEPYNLNYGIYNYATGVAHTTKDITFVGEGSLTVYDNLYGMYCENFNGKLTGNGTLNINDNGQDLLTCAIMANETATFTSGNYNFNSLRGAAVDATAMVYNGGKVILIVKQNNPSPLVTGSLTINPSNTNALGSTNQDGSNSQKYDSANLGNYKYLALSLKEATNTGNTTSPWLYVSITCAALAVLLIIFGIKNRKKNK